MNIKRFDNLITIENTWELLKEHIPQGDVLEKEVNDAVNLCSAEDVCARYPSPPFDNSAMDGYAIKLEDCFVGNKIKVEGIIYAGDNSLSPVENGKCYGIMTGAMVPPQTDAVIKREDVLENGDHIEIKKIIKKGVNIRQKGSEVKEGDILLKKGDTITPAIAGLMYSCGIKRIKVRDVPTIGLLTTGSEIEDDPDRLVGSKIFNSNRIVLESILSNAGVPYLSDSVTDNEDLMKKKISDLIDKVDFLIMTGGVSVGDKDFTRRVLEDLGFQTIIHGVSQKPGKPLLFAKRKDSKIAFGLPGNPASSVVNLYLHVFSAIRIYMGRSDYLPQCLFAYSDFNYKKENDRDHLLRGRIYSKDGKNLTKPSGNQSSNVLLSLHNANCLIRIPREKTEIRSDEILKVYPLVFSL